MASAPVLFTMPIAPVDGHAGGALTATQPAPGVYVLAWASPPDNRITTPFVRALLAALDALEHGGFAPGVVVTTSAVEKFYSNGLDLDHALATHGFWALLFGLWRRLLTFPMPTVALINGHAYAAGLMLALAHDYRLAPAPRGFLCVNEVLFGAPLKPAMAALFRAKLGGGPALRALALEGRRFSGPDAVAAGLADALAPAGLADALRFVADAALTEKARAGVYGTIRAELYRDLVAELQAPGLDAEERRFDDDMRREAERRDEGRHRYEREGAKAKL